MSEKSVLQRYLKNWEDERNGAYLYSVIAGIEKNARLAEVYQRFEQVELKHTVRWEEKIKEASGDIPLFKPSRRTRLLAWLARKMGPGVVLQSLQTAEQNGSHGYYGQEGADGMAGDERSHSRVLYQVSRTVLRGGLDGGALAQLEGRHRSTGGNALRAAVMGANDGLVSNLSLVMGVAGATLEPKTILITGLAGLLAGACSMALGEWLSVQSSREMFSNQLEIEKMEIEAAPQEEAEELALIYEARGLNKDQAKMLANQIVENDEHALDTLAREELGIDPKELGGSAWEAAITSFILFAIGAIIPVIPYTFMNGTSAFVFSILFSIVGLFGLGTAITLFTGKRILYSGGRMVIFGLLAAAVTFGIGRLIGVSMGG
jgi:VIT1/CCC1 family predicted Fe2+/Mn2+ transporter